MFTSPHWSDGLLLLENDGTPKDSDTLHFNPYNRKSENEKASKYLNYTSSLF